METFNNLLLEYPCLMYGGVGATAFVAGGALIFKVANRKKPTHANVNCWFCNKNSVVPYGNRNCWDCPTCDQYNGFQENGDYNKPIPAQHREDLNHGVSGGLPPSETLKNLQWVNCQMLLCKKCNNNQSIKIKQLASYIPREDEKYDEEIEAYKHHLEQTYKLCRPCQTAVEYYIKYQNRQLRTVLLNHQLRRTRESDTGLIKSSHPASFPTAIILLRTFGFLISIFLVATLFFDFPDHPATSSDPQTLSGGVVPPKPKPQNESAPSDDGSASLPLWQEILLLLPDKAKVNAKLAWQYGQENHLAVVSVGMLTCLTAIFMAGPVRLRRIDAVNSVLWFLTLCLVLSESYLTATLDWMSTAKFIVIGLSCVVAFAAAVATRKPLGPRRARYRRFFAGSSAPSSFCQDMSDSFIPMPPPNLSKLINHHKSQHEPKASPTSLPGRFSRALRLGTMPSLSRADSGYLFSGSRPASLYRSSASSDFFGTDYFSLKSVSRPSSPVPSPPPSVAGSVTSSSGSAWRRPLICPARLKIGSHKLQLFTSESRPTCASMPVPPSHFHAEPTSSVCSGRFSPDSLPLHSHNELWSSILDNSVVEEAEKRSSSSRSSACLVGTTTQGLEGGPPGKGFAKRLVWPLVFLLSLTANLFFSGLYMYHNWR